MTKKNLLFESILRAKVYDVAIETPLDLAPKLTKKTGHNIYLKREDLQKVFSFKIRGAYNKMFSLSEKERAKGVVAASAGNHAQGVALSSQKLRCEAKIVMPSTTPSIKVDSVKSYGAKVVLHGDSYSDSYLFAKEISKDEGKTFIHPYDDIDVIAGQGTIGVEILRQLPSRAPDIVFIAVGGGGLISGVSCYIKELYPKCKIIGVEPEGSNAMTLSLKSNERVNLDFVDIFADGVAVKQVGELTLKYAQKYVDQMITVSNDEMCSAIKDTYEDTRTIVEPAGALSIAGAKKYLKRISSGPKNIVAITCGANMNFSRLRYVSERTELGENREALFAVKIPEAPGSLKKLVRVLQKKSITEFNYRFQSLKEAVIYIGVEVQNKKEKDNLLSVLKEKKYTVYDLTKNELAKLHVRHLVGGRSENGEIRERIFRFIFPEKPGALRYFLETMADRWNITIFHYRNHGADFGRTLIGFDVPASEDQEFEKSINEIGFKNIEETDNLAIKLFL